MFICWGADKVTTWYHHHLYINKKLFKSFAQISIRVGVLVEGSGPPILSRGVATEGTVTAQYSQKSLHNNFETLLHSNLKIVLPLHNNLLWREMCFQCTTILKMLLHTNFVMLLFSNLEFLLS